MAFREVGGSDGLMFGGDGPVMTGTWMNPKTGHKFTVRDSFFQDGVFMVQTTRGEMLDYNMIQEYVQCTDDKGNDITNDLQTEPKNEAIPAEIASMIEGGDDLMSPEDAALVRGLGNLNDTTHTTPTQRVVSPAVEAPAQSADEVMIERVLKRHPLPELNAEINWPNCPSKQFETLVDILGVDPSDIAKYYVSKLDRDAIFEYFTQAIALYINNILGTTPETVEPMVNTKEPEPEVVPDREESAPKKKTTKKSKK